MSFDFKMCLAHLLKVDLRQFFAQDPTKGSTSSVRNFNLVASLEGTESGNFLTGPRSVAKLEKIEQ